MAVWMYLLLKRKLFIFSPKRLKYTTRVFGLRYTSYSVLKQCLANRRRQRRHTTLSTTLLSLELKAKRKENLSENCFLAKTITKSLHVRTLLTRSKLKLNGLLWKIRSNMGSKTNFLYDTGIRRSLEVLFLTENFYILEEFP
jgi:hypothetical protein